MTHRLRADRVLVERGLFASRAKAQAAIAAGLVTADGVAVHRPSVAIAADAVLEATPEHPWVSRGGVKLSAALDHFAFDPAGKVCLDVGASTGGFTEVLVARGARRVYAVDVGTDQLHAKVRTMPAVMAFEGSDIRTLDPGLLPELPDLVTIDASFISLRLVLPPAVALTRPPARLLALIKPQFEVGRGGTKKEIVRDAAMHETVCNDIAAFVRSLGWTVAGIVASTIAGGDGNREFFIGATRD